MQRLLLGYPYKCRTKSMENSENTYSHILSYAKTVNASAGGLIPDQTQSVGMHAYEEQGLDSPCNSSNLKHHMPGRHACK
jgi:hypothetical protein